MEVITIKLTKNCKNVLNSLTSLPPDNNGIYFTTSYAASNTALNISYSDFLGILQTLESVGAIRWGDKQHTAFALNESGKEYKQIDRLENRDRWKERIIGFVSGAILATIPWLLAFLEW